MIPNDMQPQTVQEPVRLVKSVNKLEANELELIDDYMVAVEEQIASDHRGG